MNIHNFQNTDYKEHKKAIEQLIKQKMAEEAALKQAQAQAVDNRPRRNITQAAFDTMHQFHSSLAENKSSRPEKEGPAQIEVQARDKSVTVPKVYEFQFYADFESLT